MSSLLPRKDSFIDPPFNFFSTEPLAHHCIHTNDVKGGFVLFGGGGEGGLVAT